ncbi:hypothetical protein HYW84_01245 [Candidatus Peregrinibacteria bacterium]|nr:hypothetical protein [Candidatus Peregrinibacteria bacterium]
MKIYCSGIGGIGLSAYASLQRAAGNDVSGSDRNDSALLENLRSQGIAVSFNQSGDDIPEDCDLFVYSEAIPRDAPERMRASGLGIRQQSYPQALGDLSRGYSPVIAVCGTHGKSSTTGMAARLLLHSGRDPTVVVGTKLRELCPPSPELRDTIGRNWRKGRSGGTFLLEACEYRNSFFAYDPTIILLTNCDGDHFDFFRSVEDYRAAFAAFVAKLPDGGALITHLSDPDCAAVADAAGEKVIDADMFPLITLKTPGKHMQKNAQLALALADALDIPPMQAQAAVSGYAGSWRRMELKGILILPPGPVSHGSTEQAAQNDNGDIPVIDDYGHHPREIRATLEAMAGEYPGRRIICVFQPHTHDRTLKLYADFTSAFRGAGAVVIPNIYEARKDIENARVDLPRFVRDIAENSGTKCLDGKSLAETENMLREEILRPGDVLVCMGAGDITNFAERIVRTQ